ncbi:tRNA pseudouridine(38-40) synthase TruA [Erythrobacter litoralis]|uniref:tRNA pseudouridine synthase A n=1 Tax=Erythrobacter litoralis (strain HTCC2594) TaxID=314225 RepID=TRUA_ERYLH|nr:tRNA pseudouridine(38-40) synthase TruA [Erythrobacter litoralis]Q2NCT7.1 RecName: Full=tRNA pseudouridine synthase A; AltName: Full=tRNA pseudouridine(38-40) synthase; AltName: Full=tRNA pseudouridylate synthase I; AltName: Full=tRNA-uridine isomerase I [Erythrobacter litoralis HTCC2594]ABC62504.1 tRNA pseudouridine synthase A [Erythrobacter litoralis HTCC2594]
MTRFALTLEFDGTPFMGLQRQKHGPSVQQAVEEAARATLNQDITLHSAGRTDTGVHALGMRSHFDAETDLTPFRLMGGLNAHLRPHPIAVTNCEIMPEDWHARFACIGRSYVYRIINRRAPLTIDRKRAWQVPQQLDHEAMQRAAQLLVGTHDFTTFRSTQCQAKDPVKSLDRLEVERDGDEIRVHAEARSFLHHQVRSMVGCLKLVGQGTWREEEVEEALLARDRQRLGLNAPPHGLYFVAAEYPR